MAWPSGVKIRRGVIWAEAHRSLVRAQRYTPGGPPSDRGLPIHRMVSPPRLLIMLGLRPVLILIRRVCTDHLRLDMIMFV